MLQAVLDEDLGLLQKFRCIKNPQMLSAGFFMMIYI